MKYPLFLLTFVFSFVTIILLTINTAPVVAQSNKASWMGNPSGNNPPLTPMSISPSPVGCGFETEDFNSPAADFPPVGWSVADLGNSVCVWESSDATGRVNSTGGDGFAAIGDAQWCGLFELMNTELRTPGFSLVGADRPVLHYRYDYFDTNTADKGWVDISTDGGANWTRILGNVANQRGPNREIVDLSGYAGEPNVTLRFRYVVPESGGWFQVDDVGVSCTAEFSAEITPNAVSSTLPPDETRTEALNVVNNGKNAGMLLWWLNKQITTTPLLQPPASKSWLNLSQDEERTFLPVEADPEQLAERVGATIAQEQPRPSALGLSSEPYIPQNLLYDNGPLYNSIATGPNGENQSILQNTNLPLNSLGFGHQTSLGNRVADQFTISDVDGWHIETITFYGYQTFSGPDSTFTSVNYRIWDGPPNDPASSVVFGDTTTNRLINTGWMEVNRNSEFDPDFFPRPIMANTVSANVLLPPGTYWLDWQSDGMLDSGPWVPPIVLNRHATTGDALHFNGTDGVWAPLRDAQANIPQGLPFTIEGQIVNGGHCAMGDIPWLSAQPESGSTRAGSTDVLNNSEVELSFDTTGMSPGVYTATLCIETNLPSKRMVNVPVSMTVVAVPEIGVDPGEMTTTQNPDEVTTRTFTIENTGQMVLTWTIDEEANHANEGITPSSGGVTVYGFDLRHGQFVSFRADSPETHTPIVSYGFSAYWVGGDFLNGDFSTIYALDLFNNRFASFDTSTGAMTTLGSPVPHNDQMWNGMTNDPTNHTLYANSTDWAGSNNCTNSQLYTLNPDNGTATLVAPITGAVCLIGLAINAEGELYGLDVVQDTLVRINKSTGVATVIGPVGFDADFSQGMDFDEHSGILYLATYNTDTANSELRVANLHTGATTIVGLLGTPSGEAWLGTIAVATSSCANINMPWLTVAPSSGTTLTGDSTEVAVTLDSTGMSPGTYKGNLCITSDDPNRRTVRVPVTLIVAGEPTPSPTPTMTVTPTATSTTVPTTPTPSATPTVGASVTATPTTGASATATSTIGATTTATPTVSHTPVSTGTPTTTTTPTFVVPQTPSPSATPPIGERILFLPLVNRR